MYNPSHHSFFPFRNAKHLANVGYDPGASKPQLRRRGIQGKFKIIYNRKTQRPPTFAKMRQSTFNVPQIATRVFRSCIRIRISPRGPNFGSRGGRRGPNSANSDSEDDAFSSFLQRPQIDLLFRFDLGGPRRVWFYSLRLLFRYSNFFHLLFWSSLMCVVVCVSSDMVRVSCI